MAHKKIYLAGPEVFAPDALEIGGLKKGLCAMYGFEGLYPLDSGIENFSHTADTGLRISRANEVMIESADLVIANLTPFHGPSADAGTVYEVGFAKALKKLVYGYSETPDLFTTRIRNEYKLAPDALIDQYGQKVESFGLVDNLMIDGGIVHSGGFIMLPHNYVTAGISIFERLLAHIQREQAIYEKHGN